MWCDSSCLVKPRFGVLLEGDTISLCWCLVVNLHPTPSGSQSSKFSVLSLALCVYQWLLDTHTHVVMYTFATRRCSAEILRFAPDSSGDAVDPHPHRLTAKNYLCLTRAFRNPLDAPLETECRSKIGRTLSSFIWLHSCVHVMRFLCVLRILEKDNRRPSDTVPCFGLVGEVSRCRWRCEVL